jgi:cell wall-associated NlpC family hydrolase
MITLAEWMRKASGVPFFEDGRDYDAWDCYGLVWCAYRDVLGISLPRYDGCYTEKWRDLDRHFRDRNNDDWCRSLKPRDMAIACIYRRGLPIHCGLVVPGRRIMHVAKGIQTCIQPIRAFRVEGYYYPKTARFPSD